MKNLHRTHYFHCINFQSLVPRLLLVVKKLELQKLMIVSRTHKNGPTLMPIQRSNPRKRNWSIFSFMYGPLHSLNFESTQRDEDSWCGNLCFLIALLNLTCKSCCFIWWILNLGVFFLSCSFVHYYLPVLQVSRFLVSYYYFHTAIISFCLLLVFHLLVIFYSLIIWFEILWIS